MSDFSYCSSGWPLRLSVGPNVSGEGSVSGLGISRRNVVRTAVWTTPVVMASAAAPALAASGDVVSTTVVAACKTSGGTKQYTFTISFCNGSTSTVTLSVNGAYVNGDRNNGLQLTNVSILGTGPYTVGPAVNGVPTCVTYQVVGYNTNATSNNGYIYFQATPPGVEYVSFTSVINNC